jgi:hypothetical protein
MWAFCTKPGGRPYRPTSQYLKGDPAQQEVARQDLETLKKAEVSDLVLLSPDEARFSMMPTLRTTRGVKGRVPSWAISIVMTCSTSLAPSTR